MTVVSMEIQQSTQAVQLRSTRAYMGQYVVVDNRDGKCRINWPVKERHIGYQSGTTWHRAKLVNWSYRVPSRRSCRRIPRAVPELEVGLTMSLANTPLSILQTPECKIFFSTILIVAFSGPCQYRTMLSVSCTRGGNAGCNPEPLSFHVCSWKSTAV